MLLCIPAICRIQFNCSTAFFSCRFFKKDHISIGADFDSFSQGNNGFMSVCRFVRIASASLIVSFLFNRNNVFVITLIFPCKVIVILTYRNRIARVHIVEDVMIVISPRIRSFISIIPFQDNKQWILIADSIHSKFIASCRIRLIQLYKLIRYCLIISANGKIVF